MHTYDLLQLIDSALAARRPDVAARVLGTPVAHVSRLGAEHRRTLARLMRDGVLTEDEGLHLLTTLGSTDRG